jgi:C4-dicarboxylate-binding protein DctP
MRALGANPQVTAMSEVYQSLQTGVVDGQENTPSNIYTQKMNEVQKYLTVSDHGYIGWVVIVNKKFWDGLPPDIRSALEVSMRDATRYMNAIAQQDNDKAMADIKASGKTEIHIQTPAENAAWRKVLLPVQKQMEGRIGPEIVKAIQKETAAMGY